MKRKLLKKLSGENEMNLDNLAGNKSKIIVPMIVRNGERTYLNSTRNDSFLKFENNDFLKLAFDEENQNDKTSPPNLSLSSIDISGIIKNQYN